MINWLHSRLHRPERGWDPVPPDHAAQYGRGEWQGINEAVLDQLERWTGGLAGKKVLDLGGGPGQYTIAFAERGADATWFDISRNYLEMAKGKAAERGVQDRVRFALGYMDEAPALLGEQFDLVFNRICWNYGRDDASFAGTIYSLVRAGGFAYVDTTHAAFRYDELSASARLRTRLNATCGIKIGHPFPPRGRIGRLFARMPVRQLVVDHQSPHNDRVFFEKP